MPNFRLIPHNLHDDATLSETGTSVAGFGPANTQKTLRERVLRITGNDYVLKGVLPFACSASGFGLFRHTLPITATVQLELFSDAAWSTPTYDSTALSVDCFTDDSSFDFGLGAGYAQLVRRFVPFVHWFEPATVRSFRVTFAGANSPDICRVFLGLAWSPTYNPDYGAPLSIEDLTDSNRTLGGSQRTNEGEKYRKFRVDFSSLLEADRQPLLDIMEHNGLSRDFMVSLFPEDGTMLEAAYTLNAKFVSLGPLGRQISRLTKALDMQEQ